MSYALSRRSKARLDSRPHRFAGRGNLLRNGCTVLLAILAASLAVMMGPSSARLDAPKVYAIRDAQIVTGIGKIIAKGTVVIRDGLIVDVGEAPKVPGDAQII